ncbi:amino acid adenylation domain-containing protein [Xenorhabdus doucetiae]|uniref:Amino acid adenylation domain-containing protein n=1 Tax=Xenorhabdus doucetiae TaxID=351671 RepID=A0A068QTU5_9GAMM|nr:amino acid adenylation domain-containing protein [Xenorhabdus doucetiae]TYP11562.1 amino acid adenylation domain-containing protein [Xenorhabdus doucetiae]CDG18418.1 Putative non-ribosomal peptide synthetase [Xenorhabdus doucetiae]
MKTGRMITDYFESTARENPNPAIRWGSGNILSWEALYVRVQRLAHYLLNERNLRQGECVAIGFERSPEFLVAAYAVLLAGGVYFPVDLKIPIARLTSMLTTAQCRIVFCHSKQENTNQKNLFAQANAELEQISREQLEEITLSPRLENKHHNTFSVTMPPLQATDPAYLIFTSGTTGTPKGVLVNHGAFINRLEWHQQHSGITDSDIILQRTALTFDVSLWEIFLPALNGASHYLLQPGMESFPRAIVAALASEKITIVHFVPSLLKPVLQELQDSHADISPPLPALRRVYVSGESLLASLVAQFHSVFNPRGSLVNCSLTNLYGPTEAAIDVSFYDCIKTSSHLVPIGNALTGCKLYLVDPDNLALKAGSGQGEIAIGGLCLAEGYYNRPDLTEKVFVFHPEIQERIYLTGDLGWYEKETGFFCQGRKDTQVKLRGLRIELGEIEHHLLNYPSITEAVACVVADHEQVQWLVAAIVAGQEELDPQAIRQFLSAQMPAYMLPARYWQTQYLPRSSSGKLNRKVIAQNMRDRFFNQNGGSHHE